MQVKYIQIFVFLFCVATTPALAQDQLSRKDKTALWDAEIAFNDNDFGYTLLLLEEVWQKDSTNAMANFLMGAAGWQMDHPRKVCETRLQKALDAGKKEAHYYLGQISASEENFSSAEAHYRNYLTVPNHHIIDTEVKRRILMLDRARDWMENPIDVRTENLGPTINSAADEYVPIISSDNTRLYFTSRRADSFGEKLDPNEEYFEDIYASSIQRNGWSEAINIGQPINTETHDATVSLSSDGQTMIIYRTNTELTGGDLYICKQKSGIWQKPEILGEQINSEFQEASACLTPDGQTLYFSSNRPGGYGGKDLYRVKLLPNRSWSLPLNLGPIINSEFDEDAPFVDADGQVLYFASNGHETMGGYDIFKSLILEAENYETPKNIGFPINTVSDDVFFVTDKGGKTGYYSSNKANSFGKQDIYKIDFVERRNTNLVLKGNVLNEAGEGSRATITLINEDTKAVEGIYASSSKTGKYILVINPMVAYKVIVESEGKQTITEELYYPFPEGEQYVFDLPAYEMRGNL